MGSGKELERQLEIAKPGRAVGYRTGNPTNPAPPFGPIVSLRKRPSLRAVENSFEDLQVIVHFVNRDEGQRRERELAGAFDTAKPSPRCGRRVKRGNAFDDRLGYLAGGIGAGPGDVITNAFDVAGVLAGRRCPRRWTGGVNAPRFMPLWTRRGLPESLLMPRCYRLDRSQNAQRFMSVYVCVVMCVRAGHRADRTALSTHILRYVLER